MLKDEYIREMKNEAILGFYNPHFRSLQKFIIYSSEIHFSLLEVCPLHIFHISMEARESMASLIIFFKHFLISCLLVEIQEATNILFQCLIQKYFTNSDLGLQNLFFLIAT